MDSLTDVHKLFVTCCVLHNMLLGIDAPFSDLHPHHSEILGQVVSSRPYSSASGTDVIIEENTDVTGVGMQGAEHEHPMLFFQDGSSEPTHYQLRDDLARHYNLANPPSSERH